MCLARRVCGFCPHPVTPGRQADIAVDGKASRRSHDGAVRALHRVSEFATEARVVLAQTATAENSDASTAIPALLALRDLRGATISLDALGCQRASAQQLLDGGSHNL